MKNSKELKTILSAIYCLNRISGNENEDIRHLVEYAFYRLLEENTNLLLLFTTAGNKEVKQYRQRNGRFNRVDQGIRSKRTQRREIRRYCADGYRSARGTQCRKRLRAELRAFKYARATVVHGGERKSGGRSNGRNAPRLGGKAK